MMLTVIRKQKYGELHLNVIYINVLQQAHFFINLYFKTMNNKYAAKKIYV
jgi:hypothetical protein